MKLLCALLLGLAAYTVSSSVCFANTLTVSPPSAYIKVGDNPVTHRIILTNETSVDQSFAVSVWSIPDIHTVESLEPADSSLLDLITIPNTSLQVKAGEKVEVPILIKPGPLWSEKSTTVTLVFQASTHTSDPTDQAKVVLGLGSSMTIVSDDQMGSLEISEIQTVSENWWGIPTQLKAHLTTKEKYVLMPRGKVVITDFFGKLIATGQINTSSVAVLPASNRSYDITLNHVSSSLSSIFLPVKMVTLITSGVEGAGFEPLTQESQVWPLKSKVITASASLLLLCILVACVWKIFYKNREKK